MKRVRILVLLSALVLSLFAFGQAALAGEWAPGLGAHNGAAGVANSECVYNGHDDNDADDNFLWANTPSGGVVQSGGQIIAGTRTNPEFFEWLAGQGFPVPGPGIQGEACNGHLNPHNQ